MNYRFQKTVSEYRYILSFVICSFILIIAYRIQLTFGLIKSPIRPFDFSLKSNPFSFIFSSFIYDFFVLLFFPVIFFLFSKLKRILFKDKYSKFFNTCGIISLNIVLLLYLLIHGTHLRLLFNAQIGFEYSILFEMIVNLSLDEVIGLINFNDILFLTIPLSIFWAIVFSPNKWKIWIYRISLSSIIIFSLLSFIKFLNGKDDIPNEIKSNPVIFLISDAIRHEVFGNEQKIVKIVKQNGNKKDITDNEYLFQGAKKQLKILPIKKDHPWNIIIFIMESVGTRYIFDTSLGNSLPMPFLEKLSKQGWYLKRHFTTSNISTKAIFSILSGLYDLFDKEAIGKRPDVSIPSIYNFVGKEYEAFLVTPTPIRWYFPLEFIKNSGLKEIYHFDNLPFRIKEELHPFGRYIGRDEIETVEFFLKRIEKAKEPFLGIYLSFTAHLPYFDYGPEFRILNDDGRAITRYYNNLNLLDHMIKKIYEGLNKLGLLERTILILIGDHGQAFGQHHKDNYMHHRYSYNENLETPAIFFQKDIFKPRTFEFPTSHVDILPTILDAIGVPFDPNLFDGESLFNNPLRRKFIFFYGQEGTFSCLDINLIKVQYSQKRDSCWAFNLKGDPDENNPLDCNLFTSQLEALHYFINYHNSKLIKYNQTLGKKN